MKGNQNANMSREEFNNVQAKQVANTAYNGNELYDKGIVRGKIFVLPEEMRNERVEITLNEGYQFVDENGNVINATKIVLEKKKKEYPKTYEECCKVLMGTTDFQDFGLVPTKFSTNRSEENSISPEPPHISLINAFYKLLICRDAYWKIAGEEMGLDKPWEPDWNGKLYYLYYNPTNTTGVVRGFTSDGVLAYVVLAFPTEGMRDAFYENFKEEIEMCKELL